MNEAPAQDARLSFYASALTEADRALFDDARAIEGLADEIALLRLHLREVLSEHVEDTRLIEGGVRLLIQSLLAQHRITRHQADNVTSAVANVIEEFTNMMREVTDV